jgi:hypothetical protein
MMTKELSNQLVPDFVAGVEALCQDGVELEHKDLVRCSVCLQWTCDGPHCHRPDVCDQPS